MARPQKEGLDYFPLDTDMDLKDDKIQLLEAKYGITGFGILTKLLMKIYSEGYFYQWGEKESLLFSKRVNVDINQVNDVVMDLIKWGMFEQQVFSKFNILTSNGIQKRFWEAARRRNEITIVKQYWIFNVNEILVSANINLINVDGGTQRKEKKRIEKKSKEIYAEFVTLTIDEYKTLVDKFGEQGAKDKIENLNLYKGSTGKKYASDYLTILNWERKNGGGKSGGNPRNNSPGPKTPKYDTTGIMYKGPGFDPNEKLDF